VEEREQAQSLVLCACRERGKSQELVNRGVTFETQRFFVSSYFVLRQQRMNKVS
jgi:hypothetical protein